jgi:hypothetical protein
MQLSIESRYYAVDTYVAWTGDILLGEYEPFRYVERVDNIVHEAVVGDSWFNLAQRYYWMISNRACGLYWVVCDFQPTPVVDPTLAIAPGTTIYLPSPATVRSEILVLRPESFE